MNCRKLNTKLRVKGERFSYFGRENEIEIKPHKSLENTSKKIALAEGKLKRGKRSCIRRRPIKKPLN